MQKTMFTEKRQFTECDKIFVHHSFDKKIIPKICKVLQFFLTFLPRTNLSVVLFFCNYICKNSVCILALTYHPRVLLKKKNYVRKADLGLAL